MCRVIWGGDVHETGIVVEFVIGLVLETYGDYSVGRRVQVSHIA